MAQFPVCCRQLSTERQLQSLPSLAVFGASRPELSVEAHHTATKALPAEIAGKNEGCYRPCSRPRDLPEKQRITSSKASAFGSDCKKHPKRTSSAFVDSAI
ncbi:hypothetical protein COCOBI_19-1900 [Coccomyxa sp. Obi]|nr:hypothetical protein COCOBI_19-1900 [Coccomyxa sp. Obi]